MAGIRRKPFEHFNFLFKSSEFHHDDDADGGKELAEDGSHHLPAQLRPPAAEAGSQHAGQRNGAEDLVGFYKTQPGKMDDLPAVEHGLQDDGSAGIQDEEPGGPSAGSRLCPGYREGDDSRPEGLEDVDSPAPVFIVIGDGEGEPLKEGPVFQREEAVAEGVIRFLRVKPIIQPEADAEVTEEQAA